MSYFKKKELNMDYEMEADNFFAKVPIRPLIAANCGDFMVAHSKDVMRPLRQVSEIFMMPHILEVMNKLGLNKLLRVQSHTWRHLVVDRSHGAMVVAAPRSGRTFSYVLPVCDVVGRTVLAFKDLKKVKGFENIPPGPLAVILVPDLERVRRVNALFYAFLRNVSHSKSYTLTLTVPSNKKPEFFHRLFNGVGCLVATPAQLVWVLNHTHLSFKNVKVIVYDDIDLMDPEKLMQADQELDKSMRIDGKYPQLVMVSQKYDHFQMAKLKRLNGNPALIFGDLLEAAMYGEMRMQITLRSGEDKVKEVFKLLQQRPPKDYRTVVFCSDDRDMRRLVGLLEGEHLYSCLPYYQDANLDVGELVYRWMEDTRGVILLATDNCPELSIRHAHTLIHYGMSSTWGQFKMRHLAISDNLINKLDSDPSRRENALQLHSLVLLDDTNQNQLPRLVDFVKEFQPVEDSIVAVAKKIRKQLASVDPNQNVVCRQIMMMGDCIKTMCEERHHADPVDRPTAFVPTSGDVKVLLARVYSPTHFCVYLLEHLPPGESWRAYPSLPAQQMRLQLMQGNKHERYWPPVAGAVCLYRFEGNKIRVRVLTVEPIVNVNLSVNNLNVVVQAMDEDTRIISVKSGRLYECPKELQAKPPLAIDLRLFGMVPQSGEREWLEEDRRAIEYKLRMLSGKCFLQATVQFTTSHTIFVRDLMGISYASSVKVHVRRLSLYNHLTETHLAKCCQVAKNKILAFFEDVVATVVEPLVPGQLRNKSQGEQVEEQLKEEAKENDPPNKPVLKWRDSDEFKLGLEHYRFDMKDKEQESEEVQAKTLKENVRSLDQPEIQTNNQCLKDLMECIKNVAALKVEDALELSDKEDNEPIFEGASKLLDHMEIGPETSAAVDDQAKMSRKRKDSDSEFSYPVEFKVATPPDSMMLIKPHPKVVRPLTRYYQTKTTLELHVFLPDESHEYNALLSNNLVFFHASHPSSELRHQFTLPMGVPYNFLEHYKRGRTVYLSVKKTLAITDPLNFDQYNNFMKPNLDYFDQMDKSSSKDQVKTFSKFEQRLALYARNFEKEEDDKSDDEDVRKEGVERVYRYAEYED